MKVAYNEAKMKQKKNEKIKELKEIIPGISIWKKKRKEQLKQKEKDDIKDLEEKLIDLKKNIIDNLTYTKEFYQKKKKEEDEESTIDESIEKITEIKNMINEDPVIKYELEF